MCWSARGAPSAGGGHGGQHQRPERVEIAVDRLFHGGGLTSAQVLARWWGYSGLPPAAPGFAGWSEPTSVRLQVVEREGHGFHAVNPRWVVERTFACVFNYRRHSQNHEGLPTEQGDDSNLDDPRAPVPIRLIWDFQNSLTVWGLQRSRNETG